MFANTIVSKNSVLSKTGSVLLSIYIITMSFAGVVAFPSLASALDTGFKSPTADDAFNSEWASEANAYASDNVYTTPAFEGADQSYESFNFGVPSGATITGIQVAVEGKSTDTSGCSIYAEMWSTSDNEHTNTKSAALTGSDSVVTMGADLDLWSSTWTDTDFSNGSFHIDLYHDNTSGSSCDNGATVSIDHIQVKVFYTETEPTVGDYAITGAGIVSGLTLNLSGTASGNPFVGQLNDQHISIDWDVDQNATGDVYETEDSNASGNDNGTTANILFDIDSYDSSGNDKFFTENNWTATHTYASAGTYNVIIKVHHANTNGAEGSDAATIQLQIIIPPLAPTTGGISVTKTTTGGDGTFNFTGNGAIGAFSMTTVGGTATRHFYNLATTTVYTITETPQAGWNNTGNTCSGMVLTAGATSTCLVTNEKKASLTVIKDVVNNNGGLAVAGDFTMNVTGTNASQTSFAGSESGVIVTMDPGPFSVDESANLFYAKTLSADCSGTLAAGESKTCTITNDDIAPSLTLNKVVVNGEDGPFSEDHWTISADGGANGLISGSGASGATDVVSGSTFSAGLYTLAESGSMTNYTASGWVCVGGTQNGSQITLALAQTATCTITNTYVPPTPGSITIVKNTNGGDGTFNFTGSGTIGSFSLTTVGGTANQTFSGLESEGTYSFTEASQAGWALTSTGCTNEMSTSSVYLSAGASETCTITNTKLGTIIIQKETSPDGSAQSFTFDTNFKPAFELADGQQDTSTDLMPAIYSVTEQSEDDWSSSAVCSDGSPANAINLAAGETVTCVFTNTSTLADVSVMKSIDDSTPMRGQTITYTITASNAGPGVAANVVVSDTMPAGLTTLTSSATVGAYSTSTNLWTIGTLATGTNATLTITAVVNIGNSIGAQITNTATISADNTDSNPGNDVGLVTATVAAGDTECSDGIDNDGDEATDYTGGEGGDSNCSGLDDDSEQNPQCSDGIDNDRDDSTDYNQEGGDSNCTGPDDDSEGPTGPQCSDGIDNDGDGHIDTTDWGCHTDGDEFNTNSYNPEDNDESNQNGPTPPSGGGGGGGGNGPIVGSGGNGPIGSVLGASTTLPELPAGCSALLHSFMRQGRRANDAQEVKTLQTFLNEQMAAGLPVTGSFGPSTHAAVKAFQSKHAEQILSPWNLSAPTGFVYLTTQRWINLIHCSTLNLPVPALVPFQGE